jgi:hypothetical protein
MGRTDGTSAQFTNQFLPVATVAGSDQVSSSSTA